MEKYNLPKLPYGYKDLEPYMSEQTLILHHDKHHAAYVNAANMLLDKILIKLQDWEGDFCHALYLASKKNNYLKKKVGHRLRVVRNGSEYRRDFVTDNFKSGCHFYVVSKNFAKLISASNIEPIMPIDNLFATLSASRKFRILRTRKSYVTQSDSVSSIKV